MLIPLSKQIFVIAGEASGDQLAGELIIQLSKKMPSTQFLGMGGTHMEKAGVKILVNANELSVVGAWEAVTHLKQLYAIRLLIKKIFITTPPDLVILVDYPGFNLRIAKLAKQFNIPVIYYVSPQIWAWHYKRIHHIKRYVDHMLVLFAFEAKIYEKQSIPVTFVGHPLVDRIEQTISYQNSINKNTSNSITTATATVSETQNITVPPPLTIALLPGSRKQEIKRLLPEMLAASLLLKQKFPHAQFVLPLAHTIDPEFIRAYIHEAPHIKIVQPPLIQILPFCQAAIVASGTATLEVALCQIPMVIVYKTSWLTYGLARCLIRINKIGLSNIIANKMISKELIQHAASAQAMMDEISKILSDSSYQQIMTDNFRILRKQLGESGASQRAAEAILKFIFKL